MAFTERYVSVAGAGAHDGTSEANAWTLAEAFANATAGQRANVKKGAYSTSGILHTSSGSATSLIAYRGYDTTIGDLVGTRDGVGDLITTGSGFEYPVITATGSVDMRPYMVFESLHITGAILTDLVGRDTSDGLYHVNCKYQNAGTTQSAHCIRGGDYLVVLNCDILQPSGGSGGASGKGVFGQNAIQVIGSKFTGPGGVTLGDAVYWANTDGTIIGNIFSGYNQAIYPPNGLQNVSICWNTFYDVAVAVYMTVHTTRPWVFVGNMATDNANMLQSTHATNNIFIEAFNRTRDNTTPRTNIGDGVVVAEVTTDTGGPETDYTSVAGGDFSLIADSPGVGTGMPLSINGNIGAVMQPGGVAGGLLVHPGMNGGMRA